MKVSEDTRRWTLLPDDVTTLYVNYFPLPYLNCITCIFSLLVHDNGKSIYIPIHLHKQKNSYYIYTTERVAQIRIPILLSYYRYQATVMNAIYTFFINTFIHIICEKHLERQNVYLSLYIGHIISGFIKMMLNKSP